MVVLREPPYSNYNFLVDLGTGETDGPKAAFCEVIPRLAYALRVLSAGRQRQRDSN